MYINRYFHLTFSSEYCNILVYTVAKKGRSLGVVSLNGYNPRKYTIFGIEKLDMFMSVLILKSRSIKGTFYYSKMTGVKKKLRLLQTPPPSLSLSKRLS